MGVFYYIGSVALLEDLPLGENHHSIDDFVADVQSGYYKVSDSENLIGYIPLIQKLYRLSSYL